MKLKRFRMPLPDYALATSDEDVDYIIGFSAPRFIARYDYIPADGYLLDVRWLDTPPDDRVKHLVMMAATGFIATETFDDTSDTSRIRIIERTAALPEYLVATNNTTDQTVLVRTTTPRVFAEVDGVTQDLKPLQPLDDLTEADIARIRTEATEVLAAWIQSGLD